MRKRDEIKQQRTENHRENCRGQAFSAVEGQDICGLYGEHDNLRVAHMHSLARSIVGRASQLAGLLARGSGGFASLPGVKIASGNEAFLAAIQSRGRPGSKLPVWVSPSCSLFIPRSWTLIGNHLWYWCSGKCETASMAIPHFQLSVRHTSLIVAILRRPSTSKWRSMASARLSSADSISCL